MAKMSKKEIAAIEEEQQRKRNYRRELLKQRESYNRDVEASQRYCTINDVKEKLDSRGHLLVEEEQKLLSRYPLLANLKPWDAYDKNDKERRIWDVLFKIAYSCNENWAIDHKYDKYIEMDDLYIDQHMWDDDECEYMYLYALLCGFKRIHLFNSTLMDNLFWFLDHGCKVVDINKSYYKWCDEWRDDRKGIIIELAKSE